MPVLLKLETAGNQPFIFASNKLRECVGASELTHRSCTDWLLDALAEHGGATGARLAAAAKRSDDLGAAFLDADANPPLEEQDPPGIELLTAVSGLAFVLFGDEGQARAVSRAVTRRALLDAPGLDLAAGVATDVDLETADGMKRAFREASEDLERRRASLPGPGTRHLRLPLVHECATTGLPAERYDSAGPEPGERSAVARVKRGIASEAWGRLRRLAAEPLLRSVDELERVFEGGELGWIAVVHADGNGVAQRFLDLTRDPEANASGSSYRRASRILSVTLDRAGVAAFRRALGALRQRDAAAGKEDQPLAVVPLIIGGDDLTAIVRGRDAMLFTRTWLASLGDEFAKAAGSTGALGGRLGAAAGLAFVKSHFPFSTAYDLSAELADSAKAVKLRLHPEGCALDFHVMYDEGGADLGRVRAPLELSGPGGAARVLHGRPYVLPVETPEVRDPDWGEWHAIRPLDEALSRAHDLASHGGRAVSGAQLMDLRRAIRGLASAKLVTQRHPAIGDLLVTLHGSAELFDERPTPQISRVLDLIDYLTVEGVA